MRIDSRACRSTGLSQVLAARVVTDFSELGNSDFLLRNSTFQALWPALSVQTFVLALFRAKWRGGRHHSCKYTVASYCTFRLLLGNRVNVNTFVWLE